MPRNNKRRRNNHNNNRKKAKQLNNDGSCGGVVTVGSQPTNVFVGDGTEQSIELVANQTEMGSDNSKIDSIVVLPNDSIGESENKYELSENENKIGIDEPNKSNELEATNENVEYCVDQNRTINQSNDGDKSDTITCDDNATGLIDSNEMCNNIAYTHNTLSAAIETCGDLDSNQEPKSTNKLKIPKAVIANCFTYDSCTEETPPLHAASDVNDRENAQVELENQIFSGPIIPKQTKASEDKTYSYSDKKFEPLVISDKIAFNPIMQEITNNSTTYRVDSPSAMTSERPKLIGIKKSRSMDDNDVMIQEMSDTGSIGDNEHTPIVSEAESEVESDIFEISPSPSSGVLVSVQTIPFSGPLVDLSKEEEELIQNLINGPTSGNTITDNKTQKIKKRAAIETHFLPQILNPKYLDVIKEEASDASDLESKEPNATLSENHSGNSFDDDLDDDVFLDNNAIVQKTNAVFPKMNLNFSGRRKHLSNLLKSPSADVIREEPQCFLVDTKIVDPESVEESCSKWTTTSVVKEEPVAELVYIGSSSSSASDANDQESVGEADVEDSCDEDSDVRIKTPIIGCDDDQEYSLLIKDSGFKSLDSASESELVFTNDVSSTVNYGDKDKCACVEENENSTVPSIEEKNVDNICDFVTNIDSTDSNIDSSPKFKIGAPCSNNMFPVTAPIANASASNDLPINEFNRQDSSGSICSSLSHSTTQSQSTARFCATSPPRDIADFESTQCVSGGSSLTQSIKTLRQIALETLSSMPYGSLILEELAIVAESLSHLTDQSVDISAPVVPPRPAESFIDDSSPPPIPPKPKNCLENSPPPPIPPKPLSQLETQNSFNSVRNIRIVPVTHDSSIIQSRTNSWLCMPTEPNPSVLRCLSPSQRNFINNDNIHPNEITPDLLLEMHNTFVNRRGYYHEYSDIESRELSNREAETKHLMNDDRHNETVAKNVYDDDNNRLLAIIRDSKQSTGENSAAHNVDEWCDRTFERNNQSGDKMSSIPSVDGNVKVNTSNEKQQDLMGNNSTETMSRQPTVRTYSNVETSTYETKKRVENGNVVFEFSNSTKEKSATNNNNDSNKECINELNVCDRESTDSEMMKSNKNFEKNSESSANNKNTSSPINNIAGSTENTQNEKLTNQQQRNVKAKSEYFDDKISFQEFDYIPKFFDDHIQTDDGSNVHNFFNSNDRFFEETTKRAENQFRSSSTTSPQRPQSSLQDWLKEIDDANSLLDNIVKPIAREENLCKGMGSSKVNVRAPRLHTVDSSTEVNDKFDEAQRRYEMYVTKQNHMMNRQSMIDKTPITSHVSSTRRKSLPKELQQKQLEYIRKKEQELNYEFDKLEHDRMRLLQEIEEMKVNQHVKDFVTAHKLNYTSDNFISRHQSEAELLRQQMHDEWLNKVAEREERRLQKIIKITKPGEENATPEHGTRKATVEHEFLNRVKERRTKLKMPSDSDWESGAESQPTEREKKEEKIDPKVKVIEGERETDFKELPKHIKEFASDFTTSERTDTSTKETTECSSSYEFRSSSVTTNDGIWSPGNKTDPPSTLFRQNSSTSQPPTPPPPPFWSPKSAEPSPTFDRKEFRPVKFESPQLGRKVYTKEEPAVQSPWSYPLPDKTIQAPPRNIPITTNFNYTPPSNTQKSQGNTITLLQKAKENQLPRSGTANFMQTERKQIIQNHSPGITRPNEVFYSRKNECLSEQESENERSKNMVDLGHKKIEGIGPTTKQGMPIVLRSEVDENNHHKWYKRMYNTLHKVNQNDDTITVRYKTRRGRYPYKTSGYLSEPEPNYDSDYSIYKYSTLDRRRNQPSNDSQNNNINTTATTTGEKFYGTMPTSIKCGSGLYKNPPGRIENYVPGHLSASDKERKEWWDQVMAIFDDGRTEHQKMASRSYTEGYMSRALKDQGYESDSTLVFRKKDNGFASPLSPVEQKQAYMNLQAGGEAPVQGFRKHAPEKPKDDQPIEYIPITSTLTKIRVKDIDSIIKPQREIICYPITNITRPIDLFGPFPKSVQTFVPVNPPVPPNRKSSKRNTTLQIFSDIQTMAKENSKKSPSSSGSINTGTITLRKSRLYGNSNRSRSAGSVVSGYSLKEEKNVANDFRSTRRQFCRVSSVSPIPQMSKTELRKSSASPIAFGRSISKERTFAEEKKKLEQRLPLCRKSFTASTSILRNPDLKSPDQIKKAVQTTFKMPVTSEKYTTTKSTRKVSAGGTVKTSDFSFSSNKSNKGSTKNDEKSLRLTVAISSKAKEPLATRSGSRTQSPATKSNVTRSSRSCESKFSSKSKTSSKSISNLSLARTSSTYSIDSCNSKKRNYHGKSLNVIKSTSKETVFPLTISGKSRKKKASVKEKICSNEGTDDIDSGTVELATYNSLMREDEKSFDAQFDENLDEAIRANRTDTFFQNLFLRDIPSPPPSIVSCVSKNTSVQEKARLWDTLTDKKSDQKSKHQSVYLTNKRAVSGSKFKTMEHDRVRQSRSLSPQKLFRPKCLFYDSVSKYDSFHQLSDEEEDFGSMTQNRTTELACKFEEPSSNVFLTEVRIPNSPVVIHGKQSFEFMSRSVSPVRDIRSPSCRRIQQRRTESFKANQKTDQKKVVRARSLGSSSDRYHSLDSHSLTRCNSSYENHVPMCSHQKSERFKELNRFYNNLERVGQLERATSSTDLRPIRKEGELIDFDEWKQVRDHEKAEKELTHLVDRLRRDEKEKDFLFRPKYVEDMKWNERRDSGLRTKEKSVEDLKELFNDRNVEEDPGSLKRQETNASKDTYKPLWRGNSVLDLASSMVVKYNPPVKTSSSKIQSDDPRIGISKKLISTLSRDQIAKIKNQLSEIYNNNFSGPSSQSEKTVEGVAPVPDKFVINVSSTDQPQNRSLIVRSSSLVRKEELLGPVLKRHQERLMENLRSESINSIHEPRASRSVERYEDLIKREQKEISETEKKSIFFSISKEIQDKLHERRQRSMTPIVLGKETRGAIASNIARNTLSTSQPQKSNNFLDKMESGKASLETNKDERSDAPAKSERTFHDAKNELNEPKSSNEVGNDSNDSKNTDTILEKIHYFEKKKEEAPETTIYHAREYSSPDEEEIMRIIGEKMAKKKSEPISVQGRSSSVSDFKELFGERDPGPARTRTPSPAKGKSNASTIKVVSNSTSVESVFRSRSVSPYYEQKNYKTYYNIVRTGDVRKMKDKFESLTYKPRRNFIEIPPRRFQSDPDLNKIKRISSPDKITVKNHEAGDVSWITHKFEVKNSAARGRSRVRRVISPIPKVPFKKEDRFMPHIDIISKTASLQREMKKSSSPSSSQVTNLWTGEVQKIRSKFESPDRLSLIGQMYTSSPDISELKDISNYLTGPWIAHKYPNARDNARSPVSPDKGPISTICKKRVSSRPCSTSPPRVKSAISSILKPFYDMFANQDFDPKKHRPINRYIPDKRVEAELLWRRLQKSSGVKPTVKFEDTEVVPPPPPLKGVPLNLNNRDPESPHRYVESDVNIHYKTPVRFEYKDPLSESELAYRQAEQLKKLYHEERRRKYLQEMQDTSNRRHTDNFTPSQKSPIALNRYDDFGPDASPKSPLLPRTVARALYNFQGQSARELSFKKGDIIYIRREIDKNWYEGEHNATVGLLPSNYVEIITRDGTRITQKKTPEGQARAKFNFHAQSAIELSLNKGELVVLTRRVDDNWFEGRIANRKGIFPVSYVDVLTDIGADLTPIVSSKPIGSPAAHSLTLTPSPDYQIIRPNYVSDLSAGIIPQSNGYQSNGVVRETKTIQKTEVLHVDTNSEPVAYRAIYKYRPQNSDELELQEGDIVYVLEKCDDGWFVGTSQRTGYFGTFPGNYVERN